MIREQLKQYIYLIRLNKPIGIVLLLWPTLWALWLASTEAPHITTLSIFILGVVLMRSAGCIINDYADRKIDAHVFRTQHRPLATGKVSIKEALILFVILLGAAFFLVLLLNRFTIYLSFIGVFLAALYPFLKRYTHLPQVGLGLAFSWGVPMAFAAEQNAVPSSAWVLFFIAALWPLIYDTMYAMADREDDKKLGMKSTAILFDSKDRLILGYLQLLFLLGMVSIGFIFELNYCYYLSVAIAAIFFIYQQILMKDRDPQKCFKAFLNNHWVGLSLFLGILVSRMS